MKKLLLATACALALSGAASASLVTLDPTNDGDLSDGVTFEQLDFGLFEPISYYIDQTNDGFVNDGEFVFDFGNNVEVARLNIGATVVADGVDFAAGDYSLVADYLLVGSAIVASPEEIVVAQMAALAGVSVNDYISGVLAATNGCTTPDFLTASACAAISALPGDGKIDGEVGEVLAANITDGLFNLFLADASGNRVDLGTSFEVTGSSLTTINGVGLDIFGQAIQASSNVFFDQLGNSFADLVNDPTKTNPKITVTTTLQGVQDSIPGSFLSGDVGTSNAAGVTVGGDQLYYHTDAGFDVWDITGAANNCGSQPGGTSFGGCSSIINAGPADNKWDELKGQIRAAGGCYSAAGSPDSNRQACDYDVLARTQLFDANGAIGVNAPGSLLFSGLAIMLLGLRRKFF